MYLMVGIIRGGDMNKFLVIRDEGTKLLEETFCSIVLKDTITHGYNMFKSELWNIFRKYLDSSIDIVFDSLDSQINALRDRIRGYKTISLDSMFKGDYNIRMSRLFAFNDNQAQYIDLVSSDNKLSLKEQIDLIPSGHYILVDDDSVARDTILSLIKSLKSNETLQEKVNHHKYGKTNSMMRLIGLLREDIVIDGIELLSQYRDNVYDTLDLRDFFCGVSNSGLKVLFDNGKILRVPYVSPFVSLSTRARFDESVVRDLSKDIYDLNYNFFKMLGSNIRLKDMAEDFRDLMKMYGRNDSDYMIDICNFMKGLV